MKRTVDVVWVVGHIVLVVVIYLGLAQARKNALQTFGSQETRDSWEQWREDAAEENGLVYRRRPKSAEPPALVLMRDMFWTCVIAAWIGASVLFFFLMAIIRGMVGGQAQIDYSDPPEMAPPR